MASMVQRHARIRADTLADKRGRYGRRREGARDRNFADLAAARHRTPRGDPPHKRALPATTPALFVKQAIQQTSRPRSLALQYQPVIHRVVHKTCGQQFNRLSDFRPMRSR